MIDTLIRAFRGTVRAPIRTLLVVLLLAAGLSFALTSLALAFAASDELDKIKQTQGVAAGVIINPDQFSKAIQAEFNRSQAERDDFDSSRVGEAIEPLTTTNADAIAALPYVPDDSVEVFTATVVEYEFPDRKPRRENDIALGNLRISIPDATITGTRDPTLLPDFAPDAKRVDKGRLFGPEDAGRDVIVIDQDTAAFEDLEVGDTMLLQTEVAAAEEAGEAPSEQPPEPQFRTIEVEIIGIYADLQVGTQGGFSPGRIESWYAPFETVRKLQGPDGQDALTKIAFQIDSVDSVEQLRTDIGGMLDPELFTLTTTEERYQDISDPVETMRSTSFLGMIAALVVVGLIMVMLMALVVRGRLREIGILKAVGARNRHVILQFAAETVGIAAVAVLVAIPVGVAFSGVIADVLRPDAKVEQPAASNDSGPNLGPGGAALTDAPIIDDPVGKEEREAVLQQVDASLSAEVIALAVAIAVGLGLLGALVPIVAVLRLRPAEVLRLEA